MSKKNPKKKLGELLLDAGVITQKDCEKVLFEQKTTRKRLGDLLLENGICTEKDIAVALSSQMGIEYVDLKTMPVEPAAVEIIPERIASKHVIIPVSVEDKDLYVAMYDPLSYEALEDAEFASGFRIKPYVSTKTDILWAIKRHYDLRSSLQSVVAGMETHQHVEIFKDTEEDKPDVEDLRKQSSMAPIIKMVNLIISEAVEHKASDIHLDPRKKDLVVRYRVDGLLRQSFLLPKWVQGALVSRIKIMASMDIAEKRLPQDGRIAVAINKRMLDLRVSTLPTKSGEKVVIRVLHTSNATLPVEQLGLQGKRHRDFLSIICRPQGILLVTGPTGSGKTTTMYTALSTIKTEEKNIVTVEDPVEYELEGISQVSVNEKVGLTFANALRSILRQDPDVVMVGEMRDIDTATIAMQASLTGHFVLSTLHTNDAVSTITRLRNLGIPSYLIASSMIGVIAQRLVRILCPDCKQTDKTTNEELIRLGLHLDHSQEATFYKAGGCTKCGGIGYSGRTGIYEVLLFDEEVKDLITTEAPESEIRKAVLAGGMDTLAQAGLEKVRDGTTSLQELVRVMFVDKDLGPSSSIRAIAMNE